MFRAVSDDGLRRLEWIVGLSMLAFCLLAALTQSVNPFPHDGWFESQSRLLRRFPGADNYTPIGAPAFFYAMTHAIRLVFGGGLEAQFYIASFAQNLLLYFSGVFLYLTHRLLGLPRLGLLASSALILFVQATLLAQAFWSESILIFLVSAILLAGVYLAGSADGLPRLSYYSILLLCNLLLAVSIVTRVVPILILPGLIFLVWSRYSQRETIRFAALSTGICAFVVLLFMTANLYRFGRFELSNSVGRHLWNVVSPRADTMLAGSREYRIVKAAVPDVQGMHWWDLNEEKVAEQMHVSLEELLRTLSFHAIRHDPLMFVSAGLENAWRVLPDAPSRLGLDRAEYTNPLGRDSSLPPIARPFPLFEKFLGAIHRIGALVYPYFVYGTLLVTIANSAMNDPLLRRRFSRSNEDGNFIAAVSGFSFFVFVSALYVSSQIETPVSRIVIPYLPVLALMATTTIATTFGIARPRRSAKKKAPTTRPAVQEAGGSADRPL